MIVDDYHVLHGTDQKVFNMHRAELAQDYTESAARDFFYDYKDKPLSFILRNSRAIFSETYYGFHFYRDLIAIRYINPTLYPIELKKVKDYIKEAKDNHLPDNQVSMYDSLVELLEKKCKQSEHVARAIARSQKCVDGAEKYFEVFFDVLNNYVSLGNASAVADAIFAISEPFIAIPAGYFLCIKYPAFSYRLSDISRRKVNDDLDDPDVVRRINRTNACIKEMMQDEDVVKKISEMKDNNLYTTWTNCAKEAFVSLDAFYKKVKNVFEESAKETLLDSNAWLSTNPVTAVYVITESSDFNESLKLQKYIDDKRFTNLLSVYIEMAEEEVEMGIRTKDDKDLLMYEDAYEELTTEMAILEWEDDGSPNKVIQNQIMTTEERRKKAEEEARNKKKDASGCLSEEDALSEVRAVKKELEDLLKKDGMTEERFFADSENRKNDLAKNLSKEAQRYPEVRAKMNELDNIKFTDNEGEEEYTEASEEDIKAPSDVDPNGKIPKKPKMSLTRKIQNKALDTDAKLRKKEAKAGEKVDELKSAGRAISYHPKMIGDKVDKTIADFDKWDDNRRKEFLLKPGYRHKIFKKFKDLLEYGIAANLKLGFVPILWCIKRLSKSKDKRIRNELSMELDNEIKICEEKINDASARGENDRKYELMRIRDKLDAERTRVRLNSKYV